MSAVAERPNTFRCPTCGRPANTLAGTPAHDDLFARIRSCGGCRSVMLTVEQVVPAVAAPPAGRPGEARR